MSMNEPVETLEISEKCVVNIYPDWDMENPRENYDHAGHLIIKSRDYDLTDEGASLPLCRGAYDEDSIRFGVTYVEIMEHGVAVPLYFADYGSNGARVYETLAGDANGILWVTGDEIQVEWSGDKERARKYLLGELEELDSYLQGDVYGYVVTYEGVAVDSCWGFVGYKYAVEEARHAGVSACEGEARARHEAAVQGIPTVTA